MRTNSHPTIVHAVTGATLRVLTRLVCRAERNNGLAPLRARIDHLAVEAECSSKTVRRAISALVELGWLTLPDPICRNEYGVFATRSYTFTEAFCRLVSLPYPGDQGVKNNVSGTQMSTGANKVDLSFKKDQREIEREKQKAEDRGIELPPELDSAAKEFGMNRSGVAQLRGLAYRAGYALEDIIAVGREYLRKVQATKNRAHSYLLAMIGKKSDYAARAAQMHRLKSQSSQDELAIQRFVETHQGQVYETPDMRELIALQPGGRSVLHRIAGVDSYLPLATAADVRYVLQRIDAGNLVLRGSQITVPPVPQQSKRSTVAFGELAAALGILKAGRSGKQSMVSSSGYGS
jgi:hypothetical protein